MAFFKGIEIVEKVEVRDKEALSLVYTPGVGQSCLLIKDKPEASFIYTNRLNSVAVIADSYQKALKRAIFLKSSLLIDAYPLVIEPFSIENLKLVVENIEPNFKGIDLSQVELQDDVFDVDIPVLTKPVEDLASFFGCVSRTAFINSFDKFEGDFKEKALKLREFFGGVIETQLSENETEKPVAIISDGSAVLGFGNIGALAALPVMEGKAALFRVFANVSAMPLCLKTQKTDEIIQITKLLENSFSGVNLEDISAPRCFEIEEELKKISSIAIFHDDQHGTAIVVLAALLNSITLAKKSVEDAKIIFSGAGAAAQAVCRLLLQSGFRNIIMTDINGVVYKGRPQNDASLEKIASLTNLNNFKGALKDVINGADVFIGLSAPNVLTGEMIAGMAQNPIVFALANPTPEILPDEAIRAGAFIVATGRSDFPNQVNNSLAFPGIFKGVLENSLTQITDEMKLNCAFAIASLVSDEELSTEKIIPDPFDFRVSDAVAKNIV